MRVGIEVVFMRGKGSVFVLAGIERGRAAGVLGGSGEVGSLEVPAHDCFRPL